jgi:hypothetical protein
VKKYIVAGILSAMSFTAIADSNIYAFGSLSIEHLRYDMDAWLQKNLDKDNRRLELAAFHKIGGESSLMTDFTAPSYKVGLGYRFNDRFSTELSVRQYQRNSASANLFIDGHIKDTVIDYRGHHAEFGASANASAGSLMKFTARSIDLSVLYRVIGPFFIRTGAEYVNAQTMQEDTDQYQYSYSAVFDDKSKSGNSSVSHTKVKYRNYYEVLPLIGFGADFPITRKISFRTEFEHAGIVTQGFDFYSATLLYKF